MHNLATCPEVKTPWLKVVCENAEQGFLQFSPCNFVVRVKNHGRIAAFKLNFSITGPVETVKMFKADPNSRDPLLRQLAEPLLPQDETLFTFEIAPTHEAPLRVALEYQDYPGEKLRTSVVVPIHLEKTQILPVQDIGILNLTGIENLVVRASEIAVVKNQGQACIKAETIVLSQAQNPLPARHCDRCGTRAEPQEKFCSCCGQAL